MSSIFSDFLQQLSVPHTVEYSDRQFATMPFQSLFGLSKLLESYNIPNQALKIADKSELSALTAPFIADTPDGFVIVSHMSPESVSYISQGQTETIPTDKFVDAWNGIVLLAFPDDKSREPGYSSHRHMEIIAVAKNYVLIVSAALLFAYLVVTNGIYRHISTIGMVIVDCAGLVFTYMLVQKSLNIKNKAADAVCGVLQKGGCDSILEMKVSSFFGIFKWSEVGFTYFSVSLLTLLMFPQWIQYLALCNACCLPYTVWSIWYQRFRAHHWCTLCVSVQTSLWLLFFCYYFGGWFRGILPLRIEFFVLVLTYVAVLLLLNKLLPYFDNRQKSYDNNEDTIQADSATRA